MSTHVIAARKNATFKQLATMLHEQRVSGFPVLDDDDRLVGVVSEADLLAKEVLDGIRTDQGEGLPDPRQRSKVRALTAGDLMTTPPVTIGPDEPASHAAQLMYNRRVKRLPVIDEDGRLIGIVTRSDVLSVYRRPDEEIHREITEELLPQTCSADPANFTITVRDGIVTVEGKPGSAQLGQHLIVAIRHVEGVVAVHDQLN
jgi:CBS domain-containing protein